MRNVSCLRCGRQLSHIGTRKLQMGETGWFLGDLPNLLAGAMEVDIYSCPQCGSIEFFQPDRMPDEEIAQIQCPKCGRKHDCDYPKCPFCKYDYCSK